MISSQNIPNQITFLPNFSINLNNLNNLADPYLLYSTTKSKSDLYNKSLITQLLGIEPNPYTYYDIEKTKQETKEELIFKLLDENFMLINSLKESTNKHTITLGYTIEQAISLKKLMIDNQKTKEKDISSMRMIGKSGVNNTNQVNYKPTPKNLFNHLCGSYSNYPYKLILGNQLPSPLFKERNFKIQISLVDITTNSIIKNHGKIFLQMSIHTWQIPSNIITRNKNGNKMLQGVMECEVKNGQAIFDRIQINEVTSKFINGYIGILICPIRPNNFGTSIDKLDKQKDNYDFESVKPLLIEKVIVKSKKKNRNLLKNKLHQGYQM